MDALDVARALLSSGHSQDHRSFHPGEDRGREPIVGLPHWPQGNGPRLGCGPGLFAKETSFLPANAVLHPWDPRILREEMAC